jgi:hypothetical protein
MEGGFMDTTMLILLVAGGGALVLIIAGVLLNSSSEKQQPTRRAAPTSSGGSKLGVIILGLIVLAIGAGVAVYFIATEMEKDEVRDKYGDQIADVCKNPAGSANPANLPAAAPPWKVVVIDEDGTRDYWHRVLPDDRRADDQASTNMVVCLDNHEQVVEECKYTSRTLQRIQNYVDVTVFNAENFQPITTFQVWGSTPGVCPELVTRNTSDPEGDDPGGYGEKEYFNTFYTELMKTVQ